MRFVFLLFIYLFSSNALAHEPVKPIFDNRQWELGWSQPQTQQGLVFDEYVLKGENVESWSELVTVQFLPGINKQTTLSAFEASNKGGISAACPSVNWQSVSEDKNQLVWYWHVINCPGQPNQSNLTRVVETPSGFHVFQYAIKKSPMPESLRKTWLVNLNKIKVAE